VKLRKEAGQVKQHKNNQLTNKNQQSKNQVTNVQYPQKNKKKKITKIQQQLQE